MKNGLILVIIMMFSCSYDEQSVPLAVRLPVNSEVMNAEEMKFTDEISFVPVSDYDYMSFSHYQVIEQGNLKKIYILSMSRNQLDEYIFYDNNELRTNSFELPFNALDFKVVNDSTCVFLVEGASLRLCIGNIDSIAVDASIEYSPSNHATSPVIGDKLLNGYDDKQYYIHRSYKKQGKSYDIMHNEKDLRKKIPIEITFTSAGIYPIISDPVLIVNDSLIIGGIGYNPACVVFNRNTHVTSTIKYESAYFTKPIPIDPSKYSFASCTDFLLTQPYFLNSELCEIENEPVLMRVLKHSNPLKDENGMLSSRYTGSWSLLLGNIGTNTMKEYLFDGKQYNMLSVRGAKDGAWISKNCMFLSNKSSVEYCRKDFDTLVFVKIGFL